jgi:hypothetical protein
MALKKEGNLTTTIYQYKTDTYPATYDKGELLENRAASPGSSDAMEHKGLDSGKIYYYSAFANDFAGRFSALRNALAPSNARKAARSLTAASFPRSAPAPILRSGTSVLYLTTDTGLYRRTVDDPSGFRIYLPLLIKAAP